MYGGNTIKKTSEVYINALNENPKLAKYFPLTKSLDASIFNGLNLKAQEALFPYWVEKQQYADVLEIANIKGKIFC